MAEVTGKQVTCNRCGKTRFLQLIRKEDCGFSIRHIYEDLPEDWLHQMEIGHLCSECAYQFRSFIAEFMGEARIAPSWSLDRHKTDILKGEEK